MDFDIDELLEGLDGEERAARRKLLERLHEDGFSEGELGTVAGRLASLAASVTEAPVRLVKTIGDAAMFVSTEPERRRSCPACAPASPPGRPSCGSRACRG